MRRLIVGAVLAWAVSTAALADYVLFHSPVGDWTVLCWRDLASEQRYCRLSAPRASLGYRVAPNVIEVREWAPDAFQVIVTVRDRVVPDAPLTLRVDRQPIHETPIHENGMAWWSGDEAKRILAEMRAGKKLTYRVETAPDGMPRDVRVSLVPFAHAFDTYRGVIRSHGVLKQAK